MEPGDSGAGGDGLVRSLLRRVVHVRDEEITALAWSSAYFFFLMSGYYILRPLRDAMGLAGGVGNLHWLISATLVAMFMVNPAFSLLVSRLPRGKFIPITYRFFTANLLVFFALLRLLPESFTVHVARAFYVWVSVFNLFAVSVFWGFMADLYRNDQGKRLFGFIGAGGTLGAIVGAGLTAALAEIVGPVNLLLLSVLLIEAGVQAMKRLARTLADTATESSTSESRSGEASEPYPGGALDGVKAVFRSTYLAGICLYVFLYTLSSTVVYFEQAYIVAESAEGTSAWAAIFARIDFLVNLLTLLVQIFLTGRIIHAIGVGLSLALLPLVTAAGFGGLGAAPVLSILVVFQVFRKATNYSVVRPARETLYTVVRRDEKYKAKSLMDTFVYRGGDAVGAWGFRLLSGQGLGLSAIACLALPLAAVWAAVGLFLGARQKTLARADKAPG